MVSKRSATATLEVEKDQAASLKETFIKWWDFTKVSFRQCRGFAVLWTTQISPLCLHYSVKYAANMEGELKARRNFHGPGSMVLPTIKQIMLRTTPPVSNTKPPWHYSFKSKQRMLANLLLATALLCIVFTTLPWILLGKKDLIN